MARSATKTPRLIDPRCTYSLPGFHAVSALRESPIDRVRAPGLVWKGNEEAW